MNSINEVIQTYVKAARTKDKALMLSIYSEEILIYDAWDNWSYDSKEALSQMLDEWYDEIGDESIDVQIHHLEIFEDANTGFAYFDAKFIGLNQHDEPYKVVTNRFTLGLIKHDNWQIRHQHSSLPVSG